MAHAHVHAGSCRGVYTQEKHRSEIAGTLRQIGTGCEKELFGICCVLCVGRGGEPPSVREKATAHTRTTMAVPVVCVERAVFRSLSSGGVINISFEAFRTSHRAASYKPKAPRTLRLQCIWLDSERYVGTLLPARSEALERSSAQERGAIPGPEHGPESGATCLRPPRCVSSGPVIVPLAGRANERERERERESGALALRKLVPVQYRYRASRAKTGGSV